MSQIPPCPICDEAPQVRTIERPTSSIQGTGTPYHQLRCHRGSCVIQGSTVTHQDKSEAERRWKDWSEHPPENLCKPDVIGRISPASNQSTSSGLWSESRA